MSETVILGRYQLITYPVRVGPDGAAYVTPAFATGNDAFPQTAVDTDIDGIDADAQLGAVVAGFGYGFVGRVSSEDEWDRLRAAKIFKSAVATASGSTTVWDPAASLRFRLMGYTISVAGTLGAAAVQTIQLLDGTTIIARHAAAIAATLTGDTQIGADWGNGYPSSAINNNLSISLGTTMATGGVYITAWGTEET